MILSILTILVCILLILVILIQNSKGGGIQSQFGAATQIMGVKRGTEVVEKATWALAIVLILLSVVMAPKIGGASAGTTENATSSTKQTATEAVTAPAPQKAPLPAAPMGEQPK
jgi:preprotein translocase subunit SecG